jgi:hypothetical protein
VTAAATDSVMPELILLRIYNSLADRPLKL